MPYNKITLYPNIKYNYMTYTEQTPDSRAIEIMNDKFVEPTFGTIPDVKIACKFETDLQSSVIEGLTEPMIGWQVYRKKYGASRSELIAQVPPPQIFLNDYFCSNNTKYSYTVIPVTESKLGISLQSEAYTTDWWNYALISIKKDKNGNYSPTEIWTFDYNLTSTTIEHTLDVTVQRNFTRTPKISKGQSNFLSMGVTALLGGVNCEDGKYHETQELLEKWQEFVAKDELCLWKDRKGALKLGKITDGVNEKIQDETKEQLTSISFNFTEIGTGLIPSVYTINEEEYNVLNTISNIGV